MVGERAGFQLQLGGGVSRMVWDRPEGITARWVPIIDVTVGLALRTMGMGTAPANDYFRR